jgi:hypothetical protein
MPVARIEPTSNGAEGETSSSGSQKITDAITYVLVLRN